MNNTQPRSTVERPRKGRWLWLNSLRLRLLSATIAALAVALLLAGFTLSGLFREHVLRQFQAELTQQLDQLAARLEFDAAGQPLIDPLSLSDPRWQRPYSGLYWQIDQVSADGRGRAGVLRSRSLWDASLQLQADTLADGAVHVHETTGPEDSSLLLLERTIRPAEQPQARWRLIVAADLKETREAVTKFSGVLAASLVALLLLLALAAWAQVAVGLKPLRALQRSLKDVQQASSQRLQGEFPAEVQPLVDDFNRVLDQNREVVERARTQAGNLAHALKTSLSVLEHAAARVADADGSTLAQQVQEQVALARRHIDWHLARARVSATQRLPGQRTDVAVVIAGLVRVMERVHAGRVINITTHMPATPLFFAGEEQDLHEMLGNLLDNACKWASARVVLTAGLVPAAEPPVFCVVVEDDGPGINAADLQAVVARGVRLDESVPGTGLGLAIVQDLAGLYGGQLSLQNAESGGLKITLSLPAASPE
ncbi:sensor histidine kinase [Herminiimonas sp.]|uniref:sensor histidine kinase n=1 Tax=Herminiimonas sp. TaxID=1926289 RepID=UPI002724D54C|nr:sensor histidine kinase [Herminiimonas sp.]MDO8304925.1 sensor histidine kinase [Herminiimonas sp.]